MTYTDSLFLVNKQQQLIKMVNFYEKQMEVLDDMLDEISNKIRNAEMLSEGNKFHKRFAEKKSDINQLRGEINRTNFRLTTELSLNHGSLSDSHLNNSRLIEEKVVKFEKEVMALNNEFRLYLLETV